MDWFWVVVTTWVLLAAVIALLIGRAIHRAGDPEQETRSPAEAPPPPPASTLTASSSLTRGPTPPAG